MSLIENLNYQPSEITLSGFAEAYIKNLSVYAFLFSFL